MSFHTPGRVDVEPPSVADSLRECATTSSRAWQAAVDTTVDDVEREVAEVCFSMLFKQSSRNCIVAFFTPWFDRLVTPLLPSCLHVM
jgi:hypothetical protein